MTQAYDLIVIGSGPAGQRAAIQAAKLGKKTAIVEKNFEVGGVSVHTGTIPSKTMREAVLYLTGWRQRGFYGKDHRERSSIEPSDVLDRIAITLEHQVDIMRDQLNRNGVTVLTGCAKFIDSHHLEITSEENPAVTVKGHYILIATGTHPYRPPNIPFDNSCIVDSDEILHFSNMPKSLTVIGGGVIGVEYATIFSALDVKVTLIETRSQILSFLDDDVIDEFQKHMERLGMELKLESNVDSVEKNEEGKVKTVLNGGEIITSDMLLYAAGRSGAVDQLNLSAAGLDADARGRLSVNEHFQTSVNNIYAAGDIIGFPSLAATSMVQGRIAACHMFDYDANNLLEHFPYGIYSVPEISTVGSTEKELIAQGVEFETGIAYFKEISRGQILGLGQGLLKMMFSKQDHALLGVHVVGEGATELIHIGQAVMSLGGTVDYFVDSAFNYPTLAEAYKVAALNAWNKLNPYSENTHTL